MHYINALNFETPNQQMKIKIPEKKLAVKRIWAQDETCPTVDNQRKPKDTLAGKDIGCTLKWGFKQDLTL